MNVIEKLKAIGGEAMSSEATLRNSYDCAKSIIEDGIPGDFVECGVYTGCQCGAMALAIQELGSDRKIHCFDSFCGFPKASEKDSLEWQQKLGVGSSTDPSLPLDPAWGFSSHIDVAHVQNNFQKWGFPLNMFVFHEGWFQDTVQGWDKPIALLRIDGDLYDSVLVCLKNLYPHLAMGGICILDDYGLEGGRRAFDEYFPFGLFPTEIGDGPVWWTNERTPLCNLAFKWGTDKAGDHEYTRLYYELFKDRRESVHKVLEIGIGHPDCMKPDSGYRSGASIYMWEEFFPNATIYALDIKDDLLINQGRIKSFQCDQSKSESLQSALEKIGGNFDLIVDDGSHAPNDQILTARILAPALAPDGIYIIEDIIIHEYELITSQIPSRFTCEPTVCPSLRGPERVIVIRHAPHNGGAP